VIEAAFFSLPSAEVERLASYADIPEDAYVDLLHCPSVVGFRELAALLGCDPASAFIPVRTSPEPAISILRVGRDFERALQERTADELVHAGAAWAEASSWAEVHMNPMDLSGAVISLGANWEIASARGYPLWVWVDLPV
jgi:hypothetical protein